MSGKVLATIAQVLTVDLIDAMADRAEMDRASARKAAELGVPAILSALTKLVARSGGVARLTQALAGRSTRSPSAPDDHGDGMAVLLGAGDAGALASAIGRFVGAPEHSAYALLDELTSTILVTLAREGEQSNAGGKGLASLLTAEQDLIVAAMPAGLASLLGAAPSSGRLGAEVATMARRTTARGPIQAPPRRAATASPGRRRSQASRAFWAVSLFALAAVAWYALAANIMQTGGGDDGVMSPSLQANGDPRAETDGANLKLSVPDQGAGLHKLAGETIGALRDALASLDGLAPALARLGRFFGSPVDDIAGSPVRVRTWRHENGDAGSFELDAARTDVSGQLRFVSPAFRDAVFPPLTTAVDKPAGPIMAAH